MSNDMPETPWNFVHRLVWRATTTNRKTGDIPTAAVHPDHVEQSCTGCALYPARCYAWRGRVRQGFRSMTRAIRHRQAEAGTDETPPGYTLDAAIAGRRWGARFVRLTAIGDCSACSDYELAEVRDAAADAGMGVLGYTAHWMGRGKDRPTLQLLALASTQTDGATRRASLAGWAVAQTVSAKRFADAMPAGHIETEHGQRLVLCDNQAAVLATTHPPTCNDCGLCTVPNVRRSGFDGVAFAEHGPTARGRAWTRLVQAARVAADSVRGDA